MYPILFEIGNFSIYSHGLMAAVGILIGSIFVRIIANKKGYRLNEYWDLILYVVLAGLIGGRLGYVLLNLDQYAGLKTVFYFWTGGLVSYSGLIFGFAMAAWFLYLKKKKIAPWLDLGMLGLFLAWVFARIGCFLAGDIIGQKTDLAWGVTVPVIDGFSRHPVALYESLGVLLLFCTLLYLYLKKKPKDGDIFLLGIIGYSLVRFIVDFWRIYFYQTVDFLNISQIFSLVVMVVAGIVLIFRLRASIKKGAKNGRKIFTRKKN